MRFRMVRLMAGFFVVAFLVLGPALFAAADAVASRHPSLRREAPYTPPDIDTVDVPGWLEPLEPLARLPLWGQAAVLSAFVAGMFFVVPMVFRWVWNLGSNPTERKEESRA